MTPFLPTEIWVQIFEHLCVHCHMPEHSRSIPDFRLPEARKGKTALRYLCLVSRKFRDISQEILFHYFVNYSNGGNWVSGAKDSLPWFLRSLIAKPCLGSRVCMMGLFEDRPVQDHGITRGDLESWTNVSYKYRLLVPTTVTQALLQTCHEDSRLSFNEPGPDAQLLFSNVDDDPWPAFAFQKWLHILALNLAPKVTHLQLERPLGPPENLQISPTTFSQVRVLTYDQCYEVEDAIESQIWFPNISSLYPLYGLEGVPGRMIQNRIPAMSVLKLSVSCTPSVLSVLLQFCPYLEDVECYACPCPWIPEPVSSLIWPEHTLNNLRRLAWNNSDAIRNVKRKNVDGAYIVPLLDFRQLEILEIDQSSILLYSQRLKTKSLSSVLPKTLRILHIAFARDVSSQLQIARQLRELVPAKALYLPKLSIVQIDDPLRPRSKKRTLPEFMRMTGVVSLLKDAEIDLQFGLEARGPKIIQGNRCILPPPPGVAKRDGLSRFQRHVFSLDDLETLQTTG